MYLQRILWEGNVSIVRIISNAFLIQYTTWYRVEVFEQCKVAVNQMYRIEFE